MTREHLFEPQKGLPETLPADEQVLWQGSPDWRVLACDTFHVRKVGVYFVVLAFWSVVWRLGDGSSVAAALAAGLWLSLLGTLAIGLLAGLAWLQSRAAVYTITSRRVVLRAGVAVQLAVNLPFAQIRNLSLRKRPRGRGDIALTVAGAEQLGYAVLWPHARPWHYGRRVEPMLRAVPDGEAVAERLADVLAAIDAPAVAEVETESAGAMPLAAAS